MLDTHSTHANFHIIYLCEGCLFVCLGFEEGWGGRNKGFLFFRIGGFEGENERARAHTPAEGSEKGCARPITTHRYHHGNGIG